MNIYRHAFAAVCLADSGTIIYRLEIRSQVMIHVEHIKTATEMIKTGRHEKKLRIAWPKPLAAIKQSSLPTRVLRSRL